MKTESADHVPGGTIHRGAHLRACLPACSAPPHTHTDTHTLLCTSLSATRMAASPERFSFYLSVTCVLKTEGSDFIFLLDAVPGFLCLNKESTCESSFAVPPVGRGRGKDFSTEEESSFCLTLRADACQGPFCLSLPFCLLHSGLCAPWQK